MARQGSVQTPSLPEDFCIPEDYMYMFASPEDDFSLEIDSIEKLKLHTNSNNLSYISDKEKLALAENFSISVRLKAYNATEKMIFKNQRARMKKIIIPKLNKGDEVMFRNPFHVSSLSTTLNVCGTVKKALSRNVYEVEFDGRKIMLFGSELVLRNKSAAISLPPKSSNSEDNLILSKSYLLQQLTEFVDKFRSNNVDIDDETKGFQSTIEIEDVLKEANITLNEATLQTDLLNLFYFYLDCLFLSNIVGAQHSSIKTRCMEYAVVCDRAFCRFNFSYKISGIHFWEALRSNSLEAFADSIKENQWPVPALHTCSECISNGCHHACCRRWYVRIGLSNDLLQKDEKGSLIISESMQAACMSDSSDSSDTKKNEPVKKELERLKRKRTTISSETAKELKKMKWKLKYQAACMSGSNTKSNEKTEPTKKEIIELERLKRKRITISSEPAKEMKKLKCKTKYNEDDSLLTNLHLLASVAVSPTIIETGR